MSFLIRLFFFIGIGFMCGILIRALTRWTLPYLMCFTLLTSIAWSQEPRINENPIYDAPPTLIQKIANARLEKVGEGEDEIRILHLWGTPFEMGQAYGTLLKNDIQAYCQSVLELMTQKLGGDASILEQVYMQAKPFIPPHIIKELQGMAEGSEVDYRTLMHVNLIGEASEWHCSLFGAWDEATTEGHLLQLRALDYETGADIQRFPLITVYHPSEGHAFANIGWVGVVGSVSGISSAQIALSEIGDDYDKDNDTFAGIPFMFNFRNILQYDKTLEDAIDRVKNATRTTSLLFAIGDGKKGEARGLQTSHTLCYVFDADNLEPLTDTHPRIEDVIYWGMSWNVPKYDQRLSDMLKKNYGSLDGEITIREILPSVETGNLQVAIYDLTHMILWTANAKANHESGPLPAYDRAYVRLDMKALFAQTQSF